jgi:hypothetical protein
MKKFLLPFQNMVRADLFLGSLAVWASQSALTISSFSLVADSFLILILVTRTSKVFSL